MIKFSSSPIPGLLPMYEARRKPSRLSNLLWTSLLFVILVLWTRRDTSVQSPIKESSKSNNSEHTPSPYRDTTPTSFLSHDIHVTSTSTVVAGSSVDPSSLLQLKVPFYVYTNELDWSNHAFYKSSDFIDNYKGAKHADDYWFLTNALKHPMRTTDPNEAKLFFVPTLLNMGSRGGPLDYFFRELCIEKGIKPCFKDRSEAYHYVDGRLAKSPYFQRSQGKDHVIVASHWTFRQDRWCNIEGPTNYTHPNILSCNLINFEGYISGKSLASPSMYIGRACDLDSRKIFDFSMTASLHPEKPVFQTRRDICQWLQAGNYSVAHCGEGPQCPALSRSRYGFHSRGDTWGSNRVMDTLRSRTVPLFTNEEQYKILPSFIPWRDISYLVNATTQESFDASLQDILSRPDSEYLEMQQRIGRYVHIFDHKSVYQFDAYMADFAARLGFQNNSVQEVSWIRDDYLDMLLMSQ